MKTLLFGLALAAMWTTGALAQSAVTIVYPFEGGDYPVDLENPTQTTIFQPFSFSAVCLGGNHVRWNIDDTSRREAYFYDQVSAQFVYKIEPGRHLFEVIVDNCGSARAEFHVKGD